MSSSLGYNHHQLNLQERTHKSIRDPDLIARAPTVSLMNTAPTPTVSASRSPPAAAPSIRFRECVRNHAASMGGHVFDGCGEFMPSGEEGTPEALKCAACECHRNFHRRETDGELSQHTNINYYSNSCQRSSLPSPLQLPNSLPPPHHRYHHGNTTTVPTAPVMMSFGGGGAAAESSSEDLNIQTDAHLQRSAQHVILSKKRFRTKFTQEQKERMTEFAEKLGWRIQKQEEEEVQQFCSQVGVKRKVFKVWMHNNKQNMMKKKQM